MHVWARANGSGYRDLRERVAGIASISDTEADETKGHSDSERQDHDRHDE